MYVHLGEDVMVRSSEIIVIIERETIDSSEEFQSFLKQHQSDVVDLSIDGIYKSIIITNDNAYFSPIAPGTLKRRLNKAREIVL